MKVYGALEVAQLEWFTNATKPAASSYQYRVIYVSDLKQIQVSDGTNWLPSNVNSATSGTLPAASSANQYQIYFLTDTLQIKVSNGTKWTTVGARLDTYTSGTIPAASANANQLIWVSDLQQVQVSNGTSWVQVGSKAGAKNYFSQNNANPDFETNAVTPWSACTLSFSGGAPSGAPTLSATQMSIATSATNPLAGTYSMQLTKAAANAQYQGFISGALTIDREDVAKVLYGSFAYEVVTAGGVDMSGSSTQTYEIWVYNVNAGQWIQPAGYRGMNQISGSGKVTFNFQTDGSTANNVYKIAVITQQTGTTNIVVNFDDFQIGPSAIVLGAAMTDWISYTPTLKGTVSDPNIGTTGVITGKYRRVGDSAEFHLYVVPNGTGITNGSGTYYFTLPSGLSVDTTKLASSNTPTAPTGVANILNSLVQGYNATSAYNSPGISITVDGSTFVGQNAPAANWLSAGDVIEAFIQLPIVGWSSNVQMSNDTDTRVVAMGASVTTTQSIPTASNTQVVFGTYSETHGAYNSTTGVYTIPVSGWYNIYGNVHFAAAAWTAGNDPQALLLTDGSVTRYLYAQNVTTAGTWEVTLPFSISNYYKAGQTIAILAFQNSGSAKNIDSISTFNVNRLSGPSVIAATETVASSYSSSTGQTLNNSVASFIDFPTKSFDTHSIYAAPSGAYNAATGSWATTQPTWTIPVAGKYNISATVGIGMAASSGQYREITIFKNGVQIKETQFSEQSAGAYNNTAMITALVQCNAGDYIQIKATQSTGGNKVLINSAIDNYMDIYRVGN